MTSVTANKRFGLPKGSPRLIAPKVDRCGQVSNVGVAEISAVYARAFHGSSRRSGKSTRLATIITGNVGMTPGSSEDTDHSEALAKIELDRIALSREEFSEFAAKREPRKEWLDRDESKPF